MRVNPGSRVIGKLKEEGWAKELEKNPLAYAGLMGVAGVRVAKPLTDGGTSFVGHSPHRLMTRQPGKGSSPRFLLG